MINNVDSEYFKLANLVLENGRRKKNRTGTDTFGVFGAQSRYNLQNGFPLLTTKKVFFKGIVHELLWFLSGSTNIKYLVDNDVHIWDDWAYKKYANNGLSLPIKWLFNKSGTEKCDNNDYYRLFTQSEFINLIKTNEEFAKKWGELGDGTYGGMWRNFPYKDENTGETCAVDQIQKVIDKLKSNPDDRRMIVSAWHPYWVDHCALPPCHCLFQFHTEELTETERFHYYWNKGGKEGMTSVSEMNEKVLSFYKVPKRRLNCQLYQRSADLFLGIPFNIASYSLLLEMVAQVTDMVPGEFVHSFGDLHLYSNHIDQIKLQMTRKPKDNLPRLFLNSEIKNIFNFKYEDIRIEGYEFHPPIKGDVAV